jgi:hypothetical protein
VDVDRRGVGPSEGLVHRLHADFRHATGELALGQHGQRLHVLDAVRRIAHRPLRPDEALIEVRLGRQAVDGRLAEVLHRGAWRFRFCGFSVEPRHVVDRDLDQDLEFLSEAPAWLVGLPVGDS